MKGWLLATAGWAETQSTNQSQSVGGDARWFKNFNTYQTQHVEQIHVNPL